MLLILDRDGVINTESTAYVKCPDEWIPIPGSLEAMAAFTQAGHQVVIMTNQSGIGRGYYTEETLTAIHQKMLSLLEDLGGQIEKIYYCPHHPDDACHCRKPKPGMLEQIHRDFQMPWEECLVIGDSWKDRQAAQAVGCPFWLVSTGHAQGFIDAGLIPPDQPVFDDLQAAINQLLKCSNTTHE